METANSGREMRAFLEAHFYDNGIRHLAFPSSQDRPTWAPASERTGIKNADLKMKPGVAVIEYSRISVGDAEADWLGVFWPSEDQQLGSRGNYAGVGVWSQGYRYSNGDDLVDALGQISSQVAQSRGVPEKLASNILAFMKDFLPRHLDDDATLPEGIVPIKAAGRIAKTKVEALNFPLGEIANLPAEVCKAVADRVSIANLTRDPKEDYSRLLIVVSDDHAKIRDGAISPVQEVPDLTRHILKLAGIEGVKSRQRAEQLVSENAQMLRQIERLEARASEAKKNEESLIAELSDLREVNRNLEAEHALPPELVRRLDQMDSRLALICSMNEPVLRRINSLEDRIAQATQYRPAEVYRNPEISRRPNKPTHQPEPTFWDLWGTVIAIAAIFLLIAVLAYFLYTFFF